MLRETVRRVACVGLLLVAGTAMAATDTKSEEIVQRHLDSIGPAATRASTKSRVVEGSAVYRVLVGGSGRVDGKVVLASEGHKSQMLLKIVSQNYHGERFTSDGSRTFVEGTYDDHSRSEFGQFLRSEDFAVREGLLGGELSEAWPLLDMDSVKGKLKYEGKKKVDGKELEVLSYHGGKMSDLSVMLYFDPENFHHVMTIYKASQHVGLAPPDTFGVTAQETVSVASSSDANSASRQQTRYQIQEKFSDFNAQDGLTLPTHYDLQFAEELSSGFTKTVEWEVTTTRVLNGVQLDPKNFQVP